MESSVFGQYLEQIPCGKAVLFGDVDRDRLVSFRGFGSTGSLALLRRKIRSHNSKSHLAPFQFAVAAG
jgi:hypothetical protein